MQVRGIEGTGATEAPANSQKDERLRKQCEQFEAVFVNYLLKTMRQSMVDAEDGDSAKGIYEGMMDHALANALSEKRSLGLAEMLYRDLSKAAK